MRKEEAKEGMLKESKNSEKIVNNVCAHSKYSKYGTSQGPVLPVWGLF